MESTEINKDGVPQGSMLYALFYISGLEDSIWRKHNVLKFTDDNRIYRKVQSKQHSHKDCDIKWSEKWHFQ